MEKLERFLHTLDMFVLFGPGRQVWKKLSNPAPDFFPYYVWLVVCRRVPRARAGYTRGGRRVRRVYGYGG
jgi:hypothetical protein